MVLLCSTCLQSIVPTSYAHHAKSVHQYCRGEMSYEIKSQDFPVSKDHLLPPSRFFLLLSVDAILKMAGEGVIFPSINIFTWSIPFIIQNISSWLGREWAIKTHQLYNRFDPGGGENGQISVSTICIYLAVHIFGFLLWDKLWGLIWWACACENVPLHKYYT